MALGWVAQHRPGAASKTHPPASHNDSETVMFLQKTGAHSQTEVCGAGARFPNRGRDV